MTNEPAPDAGQPAASSDLIRPRWSARRHALVWGSAGTAALLLLIAGGTALALAGASGAPVPTPVPTTDAPTPIATPEVVAIPVSTLPLDCEALVPDAVRAAVIGTNAVSDDETTAPRPDFAMMRQAGVLTCDWDAFDGASLGAFVIPDGVETFASNFAYYPASAYDTVDTVGDRSVYFCNTYGEVHCNAYLLVDDYLVEFFWVSTTTDEEASNSMLQGVLEGLVDRIRSAGVAREPIAVPVGSDAERVCSDAALEAASLAFDTKVFRAGSDAGGIGFWQSRGRTGAELCLWGSEGLSHAIRPLGLPGGAWAIEVWRQTQPDEVIAGLGRDGDGVVTCTPTACFAFAAFGDDLLAFEAPPTDEAEMERIASEFFAALR